MNDQRAGGASQRRFTWRLPVALVFIGATAIWTAEKRRCSEPAPAVGGGPEVTKDNAIATCTPVLSGRIVSSGYGIDGAIISADYGSKVVTLARSSPDGTFTATLGDAEPFQVSVEALGYEQGKSSRLVSPDCEPSETTIELVAEKGGGRQVQGLQQVIVRGMIALGASETATVVISSRAGHAEFTVRGGAFDRAMADAPPYRVYAYGQDWVSDRFELGSEFQEPTIVESDRRPMTLVGPDEIRWRFSTDAGIYFMEQEASARDFDACRDRGKCTDRSIEAAFPTLQPCTQSMDGAADCVSYANAERFCGYVLGRLPSREEWAREYTRGGRQRYPWGEASPTCALENVGVRPVDVLSIGAVCAGTRAAKGCTVGSGRSPAGLCDLAGNLGEWTSERHQAIGIPGRFPTQRSSESFAPNADFGELGIDHPGGLIGVRCVRDLPVR